MKQSYLNAAGAIALLALTSAAQADPVMTYVPNSLRQSVIERGPWTLHENDRYSQHDASGVVPPASQKAPPYSGTGTPYAGYCSGSGEVAVNHRR
ncbi:hypothetical protein, partial [Bradyrhizobium sp. STM 3809]|uniref:hypothetical protein n=1 Tax=Bradyrhizobium sp. STM 3809 TaxID=551936 RepID=UPI00055284DC